MVGAADACGEPSRARGGGDDRTSSRPRNRSARQMTKSPLFSTYRQGEDRVTSSMLAVFERIDLSLLETLLAGAAGEAGAIQMVSFVNQPVGLGASVPDARIPASFAYWFEVKTVRNSLRSEQLVEHLANIAGFNGDERLFVITPDASRPSI